MAIPFYDLALQTAAVQAEFLAQAAEIVGQARFLKGPRVPAFEQAWAAHCGASYAVACSSGTTALELAIRCAGIGEGDEVICPAMTFAATVGAVLTAGARPVLADVDAATGLISPRAVAASLSPRTRAIIGVHLHGRLVDMARLGRVAGESVCLIEDAAQAHGATLDGRVAGSLGRVAAFSFFPSKNLGACGDGGALVTSDEAIARRARRLRDHGREAADLCEEPGYNYRMGELTAAWLSLQLPRLAARNAERLRWVQRYDSLLDGAGEIERPPLEGASAWHLYAVRTPQRARLERHLGALGVGTGRHYARAIHQHPAFAPYFGGERYPEAERWAEQSLSLPLFPGMTESQQDAVVVAIRSFSA